MHKPTTLLLALLIFAVGCQPSESQTVNDDLPDRERIVENLKYEIPQLRQAQSIELSTLKSSEVEGFQKATLTVNGANQVPVLISNDGSRMLLLAGPPVDVSRSVDEVTAAMDEESKAQEEKMATLVQNLPTRGPKDAPVQMVVFSDFQCPYCARALDLIDGVRDRYPDSVNYVFAHFPLPMHGWARPASIAAQCAARQDAEAFWTLHDAYFENQGSLTEGNVMAQSETYLQGTSVDLDQWRTCATDDGSSAHQEVAATVDETLQTGQQMQVQGTPTFFINGDVFRGRRTVETLSQRIEAELEGE